VRAAAGKITVSLRYFTILQQRRGVETEQLTMARMSARELYADLDRQYRFGVSAELVRVALNGAYAPMDRRLNDGDLVVFIPPVAGG
jgi:molybdopterin synthase sulfur carrier subunit